MSLGYGTFATTFASSGCLAWAYALWPFGAWACVAGGMGGAIAGMIGARPLAQLEVRASVAGGLGRWSAVMAVLVGLWLALVMVPSIVGAAARFNT